MSIISSLYAGASGLEANSQDLSVVGDNIANANTIGFKSSRSVFADMLAQGLMGGGGETGLGTKLLAVQKILTQGSLINTGITTDLAIQGTGFFVVKGEHAGKVGEFYTRNGQMKIDNDGYLVTMDGLRVQGYDAVDAGPKAGSITNTIGDMRPGVSASPPKATTTISMAVNLQASAEANPGGATFDVTAPGETSNFSTTTTIYDSLGKAHQVDIYFRKTGEGSWEWHALSDLAPPDGPEIYRGTFTFGEDGILPLPQGATSQSTGANGVTFPGALPQTLEFDFGGEGRAGVTQFDNPSAASFLNQDGFPAGDLAGVQVDPEGLVRGVFTNGQTRVLGQVALADFPAEDQLQRLGSNLYGHTPEAGDPVRGKPATGGRGTIYSGVLEQSNVDMSAEFIKMIASQRSFQANSKTINTADQLLNEIIALKRN